MNGIERGHSHAVNGNLRSLLTNALSNELRVQWAREDRPRWYDGPLLPGAALPGQPQFERLGGRPFPTSAWTSRTASGSGSRSSCRSTPPSTTGSSSWTTCRTPRAPTSSRPASSTTGPGWSSSSSASPTAATSSIRSRASSASRPTGAATFTAPTARRAPPGGCPEGAAITGPVLTYLQSATVPGIPPAELGRQRATMHEVGPVRAGHLAPRRGRDARSRTALGRDLAPRRLRRTGGHLLRALSRRSRRSPPTGGSPTTSTTSSRASGSPGTSPGTGARWRARRPAPTSRGSRCWCSPSTAPRTGPSSRSSSAAAPTPSSARSPRSTGSSTPRRPPPSCLTSRSPTGASSCRAPGPSASVSTGTSGGGWRRAPTSSTPAPTSSSASWTATLPPSAPRSASARTRRGAASTC